eukprot:TRINITY_DN90167_c0_g1_i1.p1 TRINITY_DN90167_c0_g1~~TRINITY_DN90167_c0_g1_i1.p1  ORF type:complete len:406 (-),score=39.46 TRINITY_DN90167_c0_g1_i1:141-1358(-)
MEETSPCKESHTTQEATMENGAGTVHLKIFQFNTLAKHLAEVIQFPYAIDVEREKLVDRGTLYDSWENYGITDKHWLYEQVAKEATPSEYLLGHDEVGTLSVHQSEGKYIYSWADRLPQLIKQIKKHDPDLLFLQEVEVGTVEDFAKGLGARIRTVESMSSLAPVTASDQSISHTYDGIFASRADKATSDGIMILWNRNVLGAYRNQQGEVLRYTDGQKLALIQPLCSVESSVPFLSVTTHLHWNPVPRPGQPTLQETEAEELVSKLKGREDVLPIILGGDLNCGLQNSAYKNLLDAGFENVDLMMPEEKRRRFTMHVPRAPVPKLTDARCWDQMSVIEKHPVLSDYILVSGMHIRTVDVLRTDVGMDGEGTAFYIPSAVNGLPNKNWSASDHFPIAYTIAMSCL